MQLMIEARYNTDMKSIFPCLGFQKNNCVFQLLLQIRLLI